MPTVTYHPHDGSWSAEVSWGDLAPFGPRIKRLLGGVKDTYIDCSCVRAEESYASTPIRWLTLPGRDGVRTPYDLLFDYRDSAPPSSWGDFVVAGRFTFPGELSRHREIVVARWEREGRLSQGNNPAPRARRFEVGSSGLPSFTLEEAEYYDQVGTNLSLDHPLPSPIEVGGHVCATVREWDVAQAGLVRALPPFETSRLANTIGVAVGITAETEAGTPVILRRRRSRSVAVYAGKWHVPLSFALATPPSGGDAGGQVRHLVNVDFSGELEQELGLERADFGPLTPLAFCRDLARGGKPQFFFEMRSRVPYERLRRRARRSSTEYRGVLQAVRRHDEDRDGSWSPELAAFCVLKAGGPAREGWT